MSPPKITLILVLWGLLICSGCRKSTFDIQDVENMLQKRGFVVTEIEELPTEGAQIEGLRASDIIHTSGPQSKGIVLYYSEFETLTQVIHAGNELSGRARSQCEYVQSGGFGTVFVAVGGAAADQPQVDSIFESLKQF